jgi:hypothetical protein
MRTLSIRLSAMSFLPSLHCLCPYLPHVPYNARVHQRPLVAAPEAVWCNAMLTSLPCQVVPW